MKGVCVLCDSVPPKSNQASADNPVFSVDDGLDGGRLLGFVPKAQCKPWFTLGETNAAPQRTLVRLQRVAKLSFNQRQ
ncbi:hypothetical protein [Rhodopseudomonas palustris]|uniref:hypothetical protein n=1 Tax=Rhodopseudomonas palustris TaxID=1076 RepID=UPI00131C4170|nr:hypothetical protein [Rhodopseudomonas palustris]